MCQNVLHRRLVIFIFFLCLLNNPYGINIRKYTKPKNLTWSRGDLTYPSMFQEIRITLTITAKCILIQIKQPISKLKIAIKGKKTKTDNFVKNGCQPCIYSVFDFRCTMFCVRYSVFNINQCNQPIIQQYSQTIQHFEIRQYEV